jgi:hypothetical protein
MPAGEAFEFTLEPFRPLGQLRLFARLGLRLPLVARRGFAAAPGQVLLLGFETLQLLFGFSHLAGQAFGEHLPRGLAPGLVLFLEQSVEILFDRGQSAQLLAAPCVVGVPVQQHRQHGFQIGEQLVLLTQRLIELTSGFKGLRQAGHPRADVQGTDLLERRPQAAGVFRFGLSQLLAQAKHVVFQPGDAIADHLLLDGQRLHRGGFLFRRFSGSGARTGCSEQQQNER